LPQAQAKNFKNMETLKSIQFTADSLWKIYSVEEDVLRTYDGECARGIMHTPEWEQKMKESRESLPKLYEEFKNAHAKWLALIPPYDPDNNKSHCGCETSNGKRRWCGDHY
jgi:hypothetical protein